jgi:hypothetical protein
MSDVLKSMIKALALEIDAIKKKKKGGNIQLELREGERVDFADGSYLYLFVVGEDVDLREGAPVKVVVGQKSVDGEIVSLTDEALLIAIGENLGPKIETAQLIANEVFLVERLRDRLQEILIGVAQHCQTTAELAIGKVAPRADDVEPDPLVTADGALNEDQMRAIRRSLGSDVAFIWGPPGTGKTTTLARIVEAHYRAGRSVLIVSNTNVAVDTALEAVAERLKDEPDFYQGLVVRYGPIVKEGLRNRFGPHVSLDAIVNKLGGAELLHEKKKLIREMTQLKEEESRLVSVLQGMKSPAQVHQALKARIRERDVMISRIDTLKREAEDHCKRAEKLAADLERAREMGVIRRFFSGYDPERLERDRADAEQQSRAAAEAARAVVTDLQSLDAEIATLRTKVDELYQLEELRERLLEIRERISSIDRELAAIRQEVLDRCRILATTVYRTYLHSGPSRQFDTVIIDEASMLMPPLVYYVAGLGLQSVTVTGDFRQLPPIVMSDKPLAKEWLKRDVFEIAGIPERLAKRQPQPHLVVLGTQYRMREQICSVINDLFYTEHPLHTDPAANCCDADFPFGKSALLYVNTEPLCPWAAMQANSWSRYNIFHAILVRNIVLHLAETNFLPQEGKPNYDVGAVSPYASQVRLIKALLEEKLGDRAASIAATVHRFQGNEKRVMVLDLTDSNGTKLSHFLKATQIEEDGARLLNVAMSRARHQVVLVGNFGFLRVNAPRDGFVRRLLDHFEKDGEVLDISKLLSLTGHDWIDGLNQVLPPDFELPYRAAGIFTESDFYSVFAQDIERARESIVVFSPLASAPGIARWVDALHAAVERGIRVRVVTNPPKGFGGKRTGDDFNLVRELRDLGIAVDLRAQMHEKIAILDGRIIWAGSLNILSHRNTSGSMLRFESQTMCRQLGMFLNPPAGQYKDKSSVFEIGGNPKCSRCGGPTVWINSQHGIFFECENPDCGIPCPKPGCDGVLRKRSGPYSVFLGCSNYPKCHHKEPVK